MAKKKEKEIEEEVYLNYTIEKLIVKNCKKVIITQTGQPPSPPPNPPGGGK